MPEHIMLSYTNGPKDTGAAMIKGGAKLAKRHRDWPYLILSNLMVVLIAGGGAFIGLFLWIFVYDQAQSGLFLMPLGIISSLVIGWVFFKRMVNAQAKLVIGSRFGSMPQTMMFDATSLTLKNDHALWKTSWSGVERLDLNPHGMGIAISGIVFPVPNSAFEGGDSKQSVFDQLTLWHQAAQ